MSSTSIAKSFKDLLSSEQIAPHQHSHRTCTTANTSTITITTGTNNWMPLLLHVIATASDPCSSCVHTEAVAHAAALPLPLLLAPLLLGPLL